MYLYLIFLSTHPVRERNCQNVEVKSLTPRTKTLYEISVCFFVVARGLGPQVRKIPFAGIELTSQRVRGLRGTSELPGRPVCERKKYKNETEVSSLAP